MLTFPVWIAVFDVFAPISETVKPKICDLEHKSGVDDAIGTFQVAMLFDLWVVNKTHALKYVRNF